jgi:hypothetical protein
VAHAEITRITDQNHWDKYSTRTYLENSTQNRAGRVAQVVEHLPSKCEALSSNSSNKKNKKEKRSKKVVKIRRIKASPVESIYKEAT